jgi:hypothetical protein
MRAHRVLQWTVEISLLCPLNRFRFGSYTYVGPRGISHFCWLGFGDDNKWMAAKIEAQTTDGHVRMP